MILLGFSVLFNILKVYQNWSPEKVDRKSQIMLEKWLQRPYFGIDTYNCEGRRESSDEIPANDTAPAAFFGSKDTVGFVFESCRDSAENQLNEHRHSRFGRPARRAKNMVAPVHASAFSSRRCVQFCGAKIDVTGVISGRPSLMNYKLGAPWLTSKIR